MHLLRSLAATGLLLSGNALAADVDIVEPYARAVAPGQSNSAVFMQLKNRSDAAVSLTSAKTATAAAVELHTHREDAGVMQMRRIDAIELPAETTVELRPGGLHLMLIGLTQTLTEGESIELTLHYSDSTEQQLSVPVKAVIPATPPMQHEHGHEQKHQP